MIRNLWPLLQAAACLVAAWVIMLATLYLFGWLYALTGMTPRFAVCVAIIAAWLFLILKSRKPKAKK